MAISIDDFFSLRKSLPVVDVRSEGEYQSGHIQRAINIPLLNNHERVLVGTDYKQKGQLEAIKTGFKLVGPRLLDIINEAESVSPSKEMLVHCWRGGMSSNTSVSLWAWPELRHTHSKAATKRIDKKPSNRFQNHLRKFC